MKKSLHALSRIGKYYLYGFFFQLLFINFMNASPAREQSPPSSELKSLVIEVSVSGTVSDSNGEPIPGATVSVQGTSTGTATDLDGKYSIMAPEGATLVFSFIGFETRQIQIGERSIIDVVLKEDIASLDEVVVVGYGTQVKKDITGSVSVVSAKELSEVPVVTFAEALIGKASGVYVSTTGAPGAETTIRVRGVGSVNGSNPLVVVDGISGVSIDAINPNDIESLQILKDASSTAIYGAQGANGVIIVTTKQGGKGNRLQVSYDGSFGVSTMANSGYDLLSGWEVMEFEAQGLVNLRDIRNVTSGLRHTQFGELDANGKLTMPYSIKPAGLSKDEIITQFGSVEAWEASYKPNGTNSWARSAYYQMLEDGYSEEEARKGTNWYDLVVRNGFSQNQQISITGAGERTTFAVSLGYETREGTIKSSYFDRYSLRMNNSFTPTKFFSLGQNTNLSFLEFGGERGGQGDGSIFGQTYTIQPWVPAYNIGGDFAGSQAPEGGRAISALNTAVNAKGDWRRRFRGQTALFADVKPISSITFRSQFSLRYDWNYDFTFNESTIMSNKEGSPINSLSEGSGWGLDWQWTNTATYDKQIDSNNNIKLLVGSEAIKSGIGRSISAQRIDYTFEKDPNTWTIDNGSSSNLNNSGSMSLLNTMFGYFGRLDYSHKSKYLATLTLRRDASSRFGANYRWGTFPSASVGWRISDEHFLKNTANWLEDLKIRVGYGTTGNSNIGAYNYAFQYGTGNNYLYSITGSDSENAVGYATTNLGDPNARWETVRMLNTGIDAALFDNRFSIGFDFYIKNTSDMLVPANWSALAGGASKPSINIGDMKNVGFDLSLGLRGGSGDLSYSINGNVSTYKNKVIRLGSSDIFNNTRLNNVNITTEGQPVGMFYGYTVSGIYQSAEDVLNHKNSGGKVVLPYAIVSIDDLSPDDWVGRYKIEDRNDDGKIDASDRGIIGNPHPSLTGGANISLIYKNFDLSTNFNFSVGNEIFRQFMYYTHFGALQGTYSKNRRDNSWHPIDNTEGIYPLWVTGKREGTEAANESNSTYLQDGSYLRMQTLSIGYNLPKTFLKSDKFDRFRVYGQISNVFTITKYNGLDPELRSSSDLNKGIDYGSYGIPRQFIVGVNISFN